MSLSPHPFLQNSPGAVLQFPLQLLPAAKKDEDWQKACMDAMEAIGRSQLPVKQRLRENYRMLKGEFLQFQYEQQQTDEYKGLVDLAQQYEVESIKHRHFDFIRQIINTLIGELEGHPDTHKARASGDVVDNSRIREKSRLLTEFVKSQIDGEIQTGLARQGFSEENTPQNPEQAATYSQQLEEAKKALTPEAIQRYMTTDWKHVAEIWANVVLADARHRYDLERKMSTEFEDMLTVDACYRHFFLTGTGFDQETWNPLDTFHSYNPDQMDVEKGDFVGRVYPYSIAQVIDKFGHLLTGKQLEALYGKASSTGRKYAPTDWHGNKITYTDPANDQPYGVRVPWKNPDFKYLPQVSQQGINNLHEALFTPVSRTNGLASMSLGGQYLVTEGYWKSQKKVGKLSWIDPETGQLAKEIVDESVVLPPGTKTREGNLFDNEYSKEPVYPCIEWTWINEIWGGIKLTPVASAAGVVSDNTPIYLNVKPTKFQGKPDAFVYDAELPVVGSIFNARNGPSQSLVDRLKPFQIAYNLVMNQAYQIAEDEILPFLMLDANAIPNLRDWGGENGFEKWMSAIQNLRMAPVDTRPSQLNGANAGGQLPKVIDLDATRRMLTRREMADHFKAMALEQVGFSPQRMAQTNPEESATGVQVAMQRSYVQTATTFSKFYHYYGRTLKKTLDFSQFVQASQDELIVSALNSDYANGLLKLNGIDLLMVQLGVFVSTSQQDLRDLEIANRLALENNTILTSMADRYDMATMNSVEKIREVLKNANIKAEQQQAQAQQMEQQKLDMAQKMQADKLANDNEQARLDREARKEEAYIKTFGYGNNAIMDGNGNGEADAMEYSKLAQSAQALQQKTQTDAQKTELNRLKLLQTDAHQQQALQEQQAKRKSDEKIAHLKIEQSRIQGDKSR